MISPPNFSASEPPPTRATAASREKPTPPRMPACGDAEMVQVDPVGREPRGQRQEAAEGDEVQKDQAPGARLVCRHEPARPRPSSRGNSSWPLLLRHRARLVGRHAAGTKLEVIGVTRQPAIDAGADQQERQPGQVGAGEAERGDGEGQDQREQAGRQVADAAIDAQRGALPVAREPVGHLRNADRERGDAAAAHEAEQQDHRVERDGDVRHGDQDEHQPPHADDGDAEQRQHRQPAADLVHPGAERNAQQRAGQLRRGDQQPDQQRRELHRLLEGMRRRPVQRDGGKADEEAPGAHDQALARIALQPARAQRRPVRWPVYRAL